MEEISERGDRHAITPPGRDPLADDQCRVERFRGDATDTVAAQPFQCEPGTRRPGDDFNPVWPAGRHADQRMAAGGDASELHHRGMPGEQVAPPAADTAHPADVPAEHPALDEPGERRCSSEEGHALMTRIVSASASVSRAGTTSQPARSAAARDLLVVPT